VAKTVGYSWGPEKVTFKWQAGDPSRTFALDMTFVAPSQATGRLECVEVALRSIPEAAVPGPPTEVISNGSGAPILADYFRNLQLATRIGAERQKLAKLFRRHAEREVSASSRVSPKTMRRIREGWKALAAMEPTSTRTTRTRRNIDLDLLDQVAEVYRQSYARFDPSPARAVAAHFKRPQSTTDKWIAKAREKDKLPKTRRGVMRAFEETGK
jgi:hypothetical protein